MKVILKSYLDIDLVKIRLLYEIHNTISCLFTIYILIIIIICYINIIMICSYNSNNYIYCWDL